MQKILLLIFSFITIGSIASDQVPKTTKPAWVNQIKYTDKIINEDIGGYQYLLIDEQDNIALESVYKHYAIKVINAEGIQDVSDLSTVFDPTYQELQFHEAKIIRDGLIIDKLEDYKIQAFQRESSMERSLYDGSLTAVLNLTDVRIGDIIEYSYTKIGFNPINQGNFSKFYYHQYSTPVNRIYSRVVTDSEHDIQLKYFDGASEPEKKTLGNYIEYSWDVDATDFKLYEANIPSWYNHQRRVAVSTFKSWEEVVNLAIPLFKYVENKEVNLDFLLNGIESRDERILAIIRWVQDDVRYLGFESGISAYKPHKPSEVFNQRYGDCKDKSLLLVSLLRSEGLSAYTVWVNTGLTQALPHQLPSHQMFNHVIVYFKYEGSELFVDPTISNQGGSLWNIAVPEYKYGLIIKRGQKGLTNILEEKVSKTTIREFINVKSIGGEADFKIRTEYTFANADNMRSYFSNYSNLAIQNEYLDYYSQLYPGLEVVENLKIIDQDRNSSNVFIITEHYRIPEFWIKKEDDPVLYFEVYPLVLKSLIEYPQSSIRTMPFHLGSRNNFTQFTKIKLPETWNVDKVNMDIKGDGFIYTNVVNGSGDEVEIIHGYTIDKEFIDGHSYVEFEEKHSEIEDQLSYFISYNKDLAVFKLSWASILIVLIALGAGSFFAIRAFRNYDPILAQSPHNLPIGGWLILPVIGICLSPLLIIYTLVTNGYFNHNYWNVAFDYEQIKSLDSILFLGSELIFNVLLLVLNILVVFLFFKRRSSLPRIITILYIVNFVGPLIDVLIAKQVFSELLGDEDFNSTYQEIAKGFVGACIWIPYFNVSKWVKNTFCKLYDKQKEAEAYIIVDPIKEKEHNKPKSDLFL